MFSSFCVCRGPLSRVSALCGLLATPERAISALPVKTLNETKKHVHVLHEQHTARGAVDNELIEGTIVQTIDDQQGTWALLGTTHLDWPRLTM